MEKGLRNLPVDKNDFSLGAVFGVEKDLPQEFIISKADILKMKNQGASDLCSAYATMTASELQELVELNPDFQFAFSKKISGDIQSWGQNLRTAMKTGLVFGSLEQEQVFNQKFNPANTNLRDWNNWGADLIYLAKEHKKKSYFRADLGFGNKFDLIKSALYKNNSAVVSGLEWKQEYTYCKNAIIEPSKTSGFGHAIAIIGWKLINGKEYLIIHNSIGSELGDKGRWYLPRDMAGELRYGNFIFVDLPRKDAEWYLKNKIKITDNIFIRIYKIIQNLLCD